VPFVGIPTSARARDGVVARAMHARAGFLVTRALRAGRGMAGDAEEGSTTYGVYTGGSILSGSRAESPIASIAE